MNDILAHETGEITLPEPEFDEFADNTFILVNIIEGEHFKLITLVFTRSMNLPEMI